MTILTSDQVNSGSDPVARALSPEASEGGDEEEDGEGRTVEGWMASIGATTVENRLEIRRTEVFDPALISQKVFIKRLCQHYL